MAPTRGTVLLALAEVDRLSLMLRTDVMQRKQQPPSTEQLQAQQQQWSEGLAAISEIAESLRAEMAAATGVVGPELQSGPVRPAAT